MIYAIWCPGDYGNDYVKFGYSKGDPAARLSACQTGNPRELELLGAVDLPKEDEKIFHTALDPWHKRGEWFHYDGITPPHKVAMMMSDRSPELWRDVRVLCYLASLLTNEQVDKLAPRVSEIAAHWLVVGPFADVVMVCG